MKFEPTKDCMDMLLKGKSPFKDGYLYGRLIFTFLNPSTIALDVCNMQGTPMFRMGPFYSMTGSRIEVDGIDVRAKIEFDPSQVSQLTVEWETPARKSDRFDEWIW